MLEAVAGMCWFYKSRQHNVLTVFKQITRVIIP